MNGALLHLINVQYEDEGSYECETLNVKGMDWYRQWLYLEGKTNAKFKRQHWFSSVYIRLIITIIKSILYYIILYIRGSRKFFSLVLIKTSGDLV